MSNNFATIYGVDKKVKAPELQEKTVTDNGEVTFDEGFDGLSKVTVNVPHMDSLIDYSVRTVDSKATQVKPYCFQGCRNLKTVNLPNATTIGSYAFHNADALKHLSIPKVTSLLVNAIEGCIELQSIHAPLMSTIPDYMFRFLTKLSDVNFQSANAIGNYAFSGCAIARIDKTAFTNATSIGEGAFEGCPVTYADFQNVTAINQGAFGSTSLKVLVLRSSSKCTLYSSGTNVFPSSLQYIYVRKSLISSYQNMSNSSEIWNLQGLLDKIRAIEDYSDDGTVDGNIPM